VSDLSTSDSLLARARSREEEAWERLVDLYAPLTLHWIRASGLQDTDAADVVQEVFRAAMGGIDRFRKTDERSSFRAWLRTIVRSKVNDHFRRKARDPMLGGGSTLDRRAAPELESVDPAHEEVLHADLLRRALDEVRTKVKENTFKAFKATVLDGRPPADVAEELGMNPGAVRVAKTRVLQRLRAALGDLE